MRKSVTSQTEKAFVAYVQGNQANTVLETVSVYAGSLSFIPTVLTPPYLIFTATEPEQLGLDSGLYELTLTACLATQVDDEMDTEGVDLHRERLEALRDMLEVPATVQAYVNVPASGPDDRAVKDFTLSGIVYLKDTTMFSDRKIMTDVSYYICSCPADSNST